MKFLLNAREKRAQDRFPLGLFLYPPPVFDGTPLSVSAFAEPRLRWGRILFSGQCEYSAPVGKCLRQQTKGVFQLFRFCRTDGTILSPPSANCATPPDGGEFYSRNGQKILHNAKILPPWGSVCASRRRGYSGCFVFLNGWHYIFSTLPVASRHPAPGGEFNIRQARKFCPYGEVPLKMQKIISGTH